MKRRTFLYNASMGTLGFSCFSGLTFAHQQGHCAKALDAFFSATGARAQSWLAMDPKLEEVCANAMMAWKKTGHQPFYNHFFLYPQSRMAAYVVHLPNKELGSLDVSVLFFHQDRVTQAWNPLPSLSGFQLEGLIKATAALQADCPPKRLAGLLLPAPGAAKKATGGFDTRLGETVISATLTRDNTMKVEAQVYESGQCLWSAQYVSDHLRPMYA